MLGVTQVTPVCPEQPATAASVDLPRNESLQKPLKGDRKSVV